MLSCPFCGCPDIFIASNETGDAYANEWWACCERCGACGPSAESHKPGVPRAAREKCISDVRAMWNVRIDKYVAANRAAVDRFEMAQKQDKAGMEQ